ncbi:hypothetical protein A2954_00080 [Candidatus Roizmanbacteria bacterium RIFCSPLOWO2_01_FULL_37_12]|uniref:Glycosyltransferase RgtA/B/C/D-like domain-containing protein n=1 Tax=Candidatus Roizmanbacteria bacterium RIFCSPLOWO2_01_FULL_37_12 TaxID=1802056 RepID=A0A1F7IBF1_9BACT|nr:MAG: hypothetical protein A2954_00080 [Candidatus Roizmanbacteria bacterium RIFCSPLOWO2_01_FULL_37_12]
MASFLKSKKVLIYLSYLVYFVILGFLLRSVFLSGYYYRLNADEVYHSNLVYLMLKGFRPYADFYSTYSPFLQLYLMPVFLLFGATLKAISASRILMIILYLLQICLMFLLVKRVFGKKVALLFVPLYLMDPFMVFVGMQIRPENLMMVFYLLFLLSFSYAYENAKSTKFYFLSGILFALTLLMNLKILPSLIAFAGVFIIYVFKNKLFRQLLIFTNGFCLTFFIFFAYFLLAGYLPDMFQGLFIDPYTLNNSIPNATWLGYFYFQNPVIFGIDGKPLNWIYAWLLPVLAFTGGYAAINNSSDSDGIKKNIMKIILLLSLFLQWVSMLFINSVFIQYYIPLNWFYSVFTAYFIYHLVNRLDETKLLQNVAVGVLLIFFILVYHASVQGNIARSKMSDDPIVKEMNEFWRIVPENAPAFPNIPFRVPIYPVLWGSTFAPYLRDRFTPVYPAIEKNRLAVLTGLTDEFFSNLDTKSQQYILTNYQRDSTNNYIWKRKDLKN